MGQLENARVRYVTVDVERHRIRVPRSISTVVPWLRDAVPHSVECVGMVGPHGGIQIVPIGRRAIGIHRQVEVLLKAHPPTVDEVGSPLVQLAEFFAGTFPLDCSYEASSQRFSIILTEPARKPKLLPDAGVVALSAVNEVLVIWPKEQWVAYARRNADRLAELSAALSREEEDD